MSVSRTIGLCLVKEVLSLALALPGDQQSGDRARSGVCGYVLLGASSLNEEVGGRGERSVEKTGGNKLRGRMSEDQQTNQMPDVVRRCELKARSSQGLDDGRVD